MTSPCIELPLPVSSHDRSSTQGSTVAVFVPTWDVHQVGLLVVTAEGGVRFWENLSLGSHMEYVDLFMNFQKPIEHPKLLVAVWVRS